jgi:hypothetical protein
VDVYKWIKDWCNEVVGQPCWMVRVGGCTGSRFTLDLGAKIPRTPVRWNPAYSAEANENKGEYWLHVGCANWAFGIDRPGETRIITDCNADCSPNGPMVAGLETLIGNTVKSVVIDVETCDLNMYFDVSRCLEAFQTTTTATGWACLSGLFASTVQRGSLLRPGNE